VSLLKRFVQTHSHQGVEQVHCEERVAARKTKATFTVAFIKRI
jgi:hypothetical protein